MTVSTSCFLTALISSILSWEANRVCTHEPRRASPLRFEPPSRRRPKLAARRSAVLRARLAACRAPCPVAKAPPNPAGPRQSGRATAPVARAARAALPSSKQGSASRSRRTSMPHLPAASNGGPWAHVGPVCAAQPGGRGRGRGREATWATTAPSQTQWPAHQLSLHCQWHELSLRVEYSGQSNGMASLTSTPILVHRAAHTPSGSVSGAFASLAWIGSDAASGTAAQQRAAGAVLSGIVHRWHSVATQWMWLQHSVLR